MTKHKCREDRTNQNSAIATEVEEWHGESARATLRDPFTPLRFTYDDCSFEPGVS